MKEMEIDDCLKIDSLVRRRGYPLEIHTVTTEDGYILTLYRIRYGKGGSKSNGNPPVLLVHGMFCTCCEFLLEDNGLAYYLADNGFDVWLGNNRGTPFSKKHIQLDCDMDRKKYWNFSYHEIGYYDLPAFIDFIIENTKVQKIFYIGHSQGTTDFFVLLSTRTEYNDKIRLGITLATTAVANFCYRSILMENIIIPYLKVVSNVLGHFEYTFPNFIRKLVRKCCTPDYYLGRAACKVAKNVFSILLTPHKEHSIIYRIVSLCPIPISSKQLVHFGQVKPGKIGVIRNFDYGPIKNNKLYASSEPPPYNLAQISAPLVIFIGKEDVYGNPKDIQTLVELIGPNARKYWIKRNDFRHFDFLMAEDVVEMVNKPIVNLLREYSDPDHI